MNEPGSFVDIAQIRATLEQSPRRRAIVLVQCGRATPVWKGAPVSPDSLGNPAAEEYDLDRTLAGQPRRGPLIVLRDPQARYQTGCTTSQQDDCGFDGHQGCEHDMAVAVLAMTDRGDRLREQHRDRSPHSEHLRRHAGRNGSA
jgi:hypothetical protein